MGMSRGRLEKGSVEKISGPERVERMRAEETARVSGGGKAKWTGGGEQHQSCWTVECQVSDPPELGVFDLSNNQQNTHVKLQPWHRRPLVAKRLVRKGRNPSINISSNQGFHYGAVPAEKLVCVIAGPASGPRTDMMHY